MLVVGKSVIGAFRSVLALKRCRCFTVLLVSSISHLHFADGSWQHFSEVCSKFVNRLSSGSLVVVCTLSYEFSRVPIFFVRLQMVFGSVVVEVIVFSRPFVFSQPWFQIPTGLVIAKDHLADAA